jgi:hypothetical protein
MKTSIQDFAKLLDGNEYGSEISKELAHLAKTLGYVVVYGYSDDNVEFSGAIDDEIGAFEGTTIQLDKTGIIKNECDQHDCPYFENRLKISENYIKATWYEEKDGKVINPGWHFKTNLPHAAFKIMEDDELECVGMVFEFSALKEQL